MISLSFCVRSESVNFNARLVLLLTTIFFSSELVYFGLICYVLSHKEGTLVSILEGKGERGLVRKS